MIAPHLLLAALLAGQSPPAPSKGLASPQAPPPAPTTANDTVPPPPEVPTKPAPAPAPQAVTLPVQPAATAPAPTPTRKVIHHVYEYEEAVTLPVTPPAAPAAAAPAPAPAATATTTTYAGAVQQPWLGARIAGGIGRCLAKHGDPWIRIPRQPAPAAQVTLSPATVTVTQSPVQQVVFTPVPTAQIQGVTASPQSSAITLPFAPRKGGWFRN